MRSLFYVSLFYISGPWGRNLQHGGALTGTKLCQQDHAPVGKFQRVVACVTHYLVDLTKDCGLVANRLRLPPEGGDLYVLIKYQFGSWRHANHHSGIFRCREAHDSRIERLSG